MNRRREASASYSARMGAARAKVVTMCADFFERSGVEYGCLRDVHVAVQPELNRLAELPEFSAYRVNSPNQLHRVGMEVHRRWKVSAK